MILALWVAVAAVGRCRGVLFDFMVARTACL